MDNGGLKRESYFRRRNFPLSLNSWTNILNCIKQSPFPNLIRAIALKPAHFLKTILTLTCNMADRFPSLDEIDAGMLIGT